MASKREYLDFVLEQLSGLSDIGWRQMMGEYMIYYKGKYVAAVCDDRFLVKPTPTARALMPNAAEELPYEGAKPMLLVDCAPDRELLARLFEGLYEELPEPKKKSKKN